MLGNLGKGFYPTSGKKDSKIKFIKPSKIKGFKLKILILNMLELIKNENV